jgi:hypothetical protein
LTVQGPTIRTSVDWYPLPPRSKSSYRR